VLRPARVTPRRHCAGRRAALAALCGLAAGATLPHRVRAATADAQRAVWAWSDEVWCGLDRRGIVAVGTRQPTDPPPAPVAGGLWARGHGPDSLVWWAVGVGGGPGGRPAWQARLPDGVDALTATADGRWAAVASAGRLHLLDRTGDDGLVHRAQGLAGEPLGRVRGLAALASRRSVLVDWTEGGQWWELSLDPAAPPIHDGLVHDWRLGESLPRPGYRQPRRLPLSPPPAAPPALRVSWPHRPWALADDAGDLVVVHLDVRRPVWRLRDAGHGMTASRALVYGPWLRLAAGDRLLTIDTRRWQAVAEQGLPGTADALAPGPQGTADDAALALVGGRWWQPAAAGAWAPAGGLPEGVGPGLTALASDGTLACIGHAAGQAAVLWCGEPGGRAWTAALPTAAGPWRGLAIQPG
jgi:hypothetical protein